MFVALMLEAEKLAVINIRRRINKEIKVNLMTFLVCLLREGRYTMY
jgi:hypothetical protein